MTTAAPNLHAELERYREVVRIIRRRRGIQPVCGGPGMGSGTCIELGYRNPCDACQLTEALKRLP